MPSVNNPDREMLHRALRHGGLSVVTYRQREPVPDGIVELRRMHHLCSAGLLRLDRIRGDKDDPVGEVRTDFKLTPKGERAAR